jgi:hypothetical protein
MSESDRAHEDRRDVFTVIEELRISGRISPAEWAEIERQQEIFLRNVALTPAPLRGLLLQAFRLGSLVGAHVGAFDAAPKTKEHADSRRGSTAGKASGKARQLRPCHEHAKELALAICAENQEMSQIEVAAEIAERWKLAGKRQKISTFVTFVQKLKRDGKLPKRIS